MLINVLAIIGVLALIVVALAVVAVIVIIPEPWDPRWDDGD